MTGAPTQRMRERERAVTRLATSDDMGPIALPADTETIEPILVMKAASIQEKRLSAGAVISAITRNEWMPMDEALAGGPGASDALKEEACKLLEGLHFWAGLFLNKEPTPQDWKSTLINKRHIEGLLGWSMATFRLVQKFSRMHPGCEMRHISWQEFHQTPVTGFDVKSFLSCIPETPILRPQVEELSERIASLDTIGTPTVTGNNSSRAAPELYSCTITISVTEPSATTPAPLSDDGSDGSYLEVVNEESSCCMHNNHEVPSLSLCNNTKGNGSLVEFEQDEWVDLCSEPELDPEQWILLQTSKYPTHPTLTSTAVQS